MPFQIECAQSFSSENAKESDINYAFDNDKSRGEYVILTAPDGSYIQAAGDGDDPYTLEYRVATTKQHFRATGDLTKDQVREAFLQYLRGDEGWKSARQWEEQKAAKGCLPVLLLAIAMVGAVVHVIA